MLSSSIHSCLCCTQGPLGKQGLQGLPGIDGPAVSTNTIQYTQYNTIQELTKPETQNMYVSTS